MSSLNIVTDRLKLMSQPDKPSRSLYQHLSQIVPQLATFENEKIPPISHLDIISEYVKKYHFSPQQLLSEQKLREFLNKEIQYPGWLAQEEALRQFSSKRTSERIVNHFQLQAERLFGKVGIGFGREQSHNIYAALKRLAETKDATRLRFWGKILTRSKDYYVVEGQTKLSNAGEASGDMQKAREGANYNSYWVADDILSQSWYELPLITPQQMTAARLIKYAFKGDLNAQIVSSPPFPGQEKHLLKAQIVRITHNCQIAPKGLYSSLEDNPDQIDYAQEFKMPDLSELANLENWVHINPYVLKMGRSSYYIDPKIAEEQKEEQLAKLAETDPKIERLKAINEDKGLQKYGLEGCWSTRTYGSAQLFNNVGKEQGSTSCYAVSTLRNPHWPGWTTVASSKDFGSIYIGDGVKSSQASFHPLGPEDISLEGDDYDEFGEPNPKDPPDELEPDSDDENKKIEE